MPIDEKKLIAIYASGSNVRDLAKDFDITPQTIYNILKRNEVQKRGSRNYSKKEKLLEACRGGAIASVVAKQLGLSESTATRTLRKRREYGETLDIKKGRPELSRSRIFSAPGTSPMLNKEYEYLSLIPFPYPKISPEKTKYELDRIKRFVSHLEGDVIKPQSPVGVKLCTPFFPNRYKAISTSMSAFAAWQDANKLQKAIQFQIDHGDPTTPDRVLRALTMHCRTPSVFRPAVAKFVYEKYCPKGGTVWDPCSGYGGRLLGAFAAGVHYIGTDVDSATISGNRELARTINADVELHEIPAETFAPPKVDLVFTSPPYFNREKYSREDDQSWRRYVKLDSWVDGFLRPVIERAHEALPINGHFVINIADFKENRKLIPLVELTINISLACGFLHKETLRMPLSGSFRTEPVIVFRKL